MRYVRNLASHVSEGRKGAILSQQNTNQQSSIFIN